MMALGCSGDGWHPASDWFRDSSRAQHVVQMRKMKWSYILDGVWLLLAVLHAFDNQINTADQFPSKTPM
jgi:hypothetical protein